jgi:hypothetical protein
MAVKDEVSRTKKGYNDLGEAIRSNEKRLRDLGRTQSGLGAAFRGIGQQLTNGLNQAFTAARARVPQLATTISSGLASGFRSGVGVASGLIGGLIDRLRGINRTPIAPPVQVDLGALTGGLQRAVVLGQILAQTLIAAGRAGFGRAVPPFWA